MPRNWFGRLIERVFSRRQPRGRRPVPPRVHRIVRPRVETLEDRTLLSGAHDTALLASLRGALGPGGNTLAAWANRLSDSSALGREVPIIGTQLASRLKPG